MRVIFLCSLLSLHYIFLKKIYNLMAVFFSEILGPWKVIFSLWCSWKQLCADVFMAVEMQKWKFCSRAFHRLLPKWILSLVAFPCSTSFSSSPYLGWVLLPWRGNREFILSILNHAHPREEQAASMHMRVHVRSSNQMSSGHSEILPVHRRRPGHLWPRGE